MAYKKVSPINDKRIAEYTNRRRNGSTQIFYSGKDYRDFDRYRAEGGARKPNVKMHNKVDTITIQPPEKHLYAELIDGQWWWVNGCTECNNQPRNSISSYVECEKHDVCATCKKQRNSFNEPVWSYISGWQCNHCKREQDHHDKVEALKKVADEEFDEWDFFNNDEIVCPHCKTSFKPDGEQDAEQECDTCGGEYSVETEYSVTYSTKVIGERLTLDSITA